jgi:hypothetical protein
MTCDMRLNIGEKTQTPEHTARPKRMPIFHDLEPAAVLNLGLGNRWNGSPSEMAMLLWSGDRQDEDPRRTMARSEQKVNDA